MDGKVNIHMQHKLVTKYLMTLTFHFSYIFVFVLFYVFIPAEFVLVLLM